jgi:hypothetical protein
MRLANRAFTDADIRASCWENVLCSWLDGKAGSWSGCGCHQSQQVVDVAKSQVPRVAIARYDNSNSTHSGLRCGCCGGCHNGSDVHCRWHRRHQSTRRQW